MQKGATYALENTVPHISCEAWGWRAGDLSLNDPKSGPQLEQKLFDGTPMSKVNNPGLNSTVLSPVL